MTQGFPGSCVLPLPSGGMRRGGEQTSPCPGHAPHRAMLEKTPSSLNLLSSRKLLVSEALLEQPVLPLWASPDSLCLPTQPGQSQDGCLTALHACGARDMDIGVELTCHASGPGGFLKGVQP